MLAQFAARLLYTRRIILSTYRLNIFLFEGVSYTLRFSVMAAEVLAITARFAPTAERETRQKYRAATVSWQLLRYFLEYAAGIAKMVIPLANGDGELAKKEKARLVDAFSHHEIYIERYYDHCLASRVLEEMVR